VAAVACGQSNNAGFGGGGSGSGGRGGSGGSSGAGSGGSSGGGGGTSNGGSGGSSGSGSGGSSGSFGTSSGGIDAGNGCSGEATSFVYVLSSDNDLYSFAPDKKQFTKIGPLGCQTTMQPNSMAVDRNAVAWVNYVGTMGNRDSAGVIFQVSTKDASCAPMPAMNLPAGWYRLGMGYSTNGGAGTTAETLFVSGNQGGNGPGVASVDLATATLTPVGPFTGALAGQDAELTGTGDGRLFGYFTTSPVQVGEIDKATGATPMPVPMTGVAAPSDWAFSFWGAHFYLYAAPGQGNGSDVIDYDPATGSINTSYMTGIGFTIVGAGVSTCAPVVMPPPQ
jgi:hypothetical protein